MEFKHWPKITRVENRKPPVFTEKLDGTNGCIVISFEEADENTVASLVTEVGLMSVWAQSRNRFIKPGDDNYGFAAWVLKNIEELTKLGEGHHYGEWWGLGVGRGYNETEKRFSLFNTHRWGPHNPNTPACVSVVPRLRVTTVEEAKQFLINNGSIASPGYMNPEGAVMYDIDSDTNFKIIINK